MGIQFALLEMTGAVGKNALGSQPIGVMFQRQSEKRDLTSDHYPISSASVKMARLPRQ